nr:reverse transcriptase domain-containing protein [Tanacetum cinerariifolium]
MRTRSLSRNNFPQQEASQAIVEPLHIELSFLEDQFQEDPLEDPPEVPMADNRTMAELLQEPTEGYEDAIVIPEIAANNFELKHSLINLVQNKQFFGYDKEDPHDHIRYFNKITSTMRVPNVPSSSIKLMLFPFSLEIKSKVRQTRAKVVVAKVSMSSSTPAISSEVSELKDMVRALLIDKKNQSSAPAQSSTPALVKAVYQPLAYQAPSYQAPIPQIQSVSKTDFESYVKANDAVLRNIQNQGQNLQIQMANLTDMLSKFVSSNTASSSGTKCKLQAHKVPAPVQPPVIQSETQTLVSEPIVAPVSVPMPNLKPSIPYPLRRDNERRRDQANEQIEKFYEIFKDMSFEISFTDALILMPKFASTLKALIGNKENLSEMARTSMNEHCSTVILNKLQRKLGDPGKFLIPCEFLGMDECLALADLGASINLMPLSVWEGLSLSELTPTCMTLELADRSVSKPIGIAKDVSVKVGVFHFPTDFVVVDFEPDPRVPLILRRCFLKTGRALIDVHKGELTLRIRNKAITYNLDQTSRYSANYNHMTANKIDIICEEYSQEVLSFSDTTASGNPTPYDDPIVSTTSPTLTLFGDSDFLLFEEADAFLAILNSKPLPPLLNHEQYLPSSKKELKVYEAKTVKSSVDEPPEVELKDLPPHLEYTFLEGDNKFPVIITKELGDKEKSTLIKVLKSHKRAIAWKLSNIQGNEYYCFLDGFSGYFQIPIDPRDQEKTTFTCPYEMFAFQRIPFGLCNAPGTFQRCMLAIFHDMVEKTIKVFMDDFSVFGNSFENCLSCLDKMLQRCEDTNLSLNWEKSHFMVKKGIVLGHKISKNEIEVDKAKIDVIAKLPHPTTVKGIRSFLGHVGFYWRFIQDFSKISRPMTHLLEKNTLFIFSEDCIKAFQMLKKKLTKAPILIAPNWDLPFELMCDANDFAIEKEMLAVVYAFEKFWSYLIMNKSIVHTDHSALKYLFAKKDAKARLLRKLKIRWSGPFTIAKVFPYGTVEQSQANGPNFKVNGHRVKHYFGRDVPQLVVPDLQTFPMNQ